MKKQLPTLAEFLGWEEGFVYYVPKYDTHQKIQNGKMYLKRITRTGKTSWDLSCTAWTDQIINNYREAKKV